MQLWVYEQFLASFPVFAVATFWNTWTRPFDKTKNATGPPVLYTRLSTSLTLGLNGLDTVVSTWAYEVWQFRSAKAHMSMDDGPEKKMWWTHVALMESPSASNSASSKAQLSTWLRKRWRTPCQSNPDICGLPTCEQCPESISKLLTVHVNVHPHLYLLSKTTCMQYRAVTCCLDMYKQLPTLVPTVGSAKKTLRGHPLQRTLPPREAHVHCVEPWSGVPCESLSVLQ